jgi:ABC-2 type transport system permease protein
MRAFLAIFKREVAHYFTSPIAYVVLVIFAVLGGWFYVQGFLLPFAAYCQQYPIIQMQMQQNPMMMMQQPPVPNFMELVVPSLFGTLSIILVFLVPLLTMRSIAEEKKEGTIELLYTYPVSDTQVVLAKYLASVVVFLLIIVQVAVYLVVPDLMMEGSAVIEWKTALASLLGFFLLGASSIALGFIFSAVTENQIVSASLTFALLLFLWVVGWAAQGDQLEGFLKTLAETVSLTNRSEDLYKGLINLSDVVFFACVVVGSLFITMRALESHRWRG